LIWYVPSAVAVQETVLWTPALWLGAVAFVVEPDIILSVYLKPDGSSRRTVIVCPARAVNLYQSDVSVPLMSDPDQGPGTMVTWPDAVAEDGASAPWPASFCAAYAPRGEICAPTGAMADCSAVSLLPLEVDPALRAATLAIIPGISETR